MTMFGFKRKIVVAVATAIIFMAGGPATAQQAGGFAVELPDVNNFVALGLGALPDYEGSDDYTIGIGPAALLKPWGNNRYIQLIATELSLNILNSRNWSFGPVANYRFARDDVDDDVVALFKDVNAALELGGFLAWTWIGDDDPRHRFAFSGQFLQDVTGNHEGFLATVSGRYFVPVARPLTLSAGVSATYGSSDFMQTYFGVDATDAGRSGLSQYSLGGGVRDVSFPLMAIFSFSPSWHLSAGGIIKILVNDAADSPLVAVRGDDTQIILGAGFAYAW